MSCTKVSVTEQKILIPTYRAGTPEKSPLFIEKRAYQGSSGRVYPLPVTETISNVKEDVAYTALILENEYLQVTILPELGGRIQRALDKTNQYDFVYYNHVIKPALVGLAGPWISGGIEFNWPQHHRPTTFAPVEYSWRRNDDGSCTVSVGEIDPMYGMKGMANISLYPGKAYIEIRGQLFNPGDMAQPFLWWANPAVPVNDDTYSVFPPDVNAVMDHGRRAVSTFPIATGEYYKYDYSAGVDISRYKNIRVPTSYMAAHSDYDFIGNYDEGLGAGLLHVADHHICPGKKQWTWGNSDFGRCWDDNLTDGDGPYIELMTGVFADNQPDFTWLRPQEEKTFVQYFMPYKGVGRVGNATRDAAIGVELEDPHCAVLRVYASGEYPGAVITAAGPDGTNLLKRTADLTPESFYEVVYDAGDAPENGLIRVSAADGRELAAYRIDIPKISPVPEPAEPMPQPEAVKSTEELFLDALHLEQYHHATRDPRDYYLEGLRRDPGDARINNALGRLELQAGKPAAAEACFRKAIERQNLCNTNPYDGEAWFHLGLALQDQGKKDEAFDAFFKASWSGDRKGSALYHLACIRAGEGDYAQALEFTEQSLLCGWHNMNSRVLKAALLRLLSVPSAEFLRESLAIDPLSMGILYEKALQAGDLAAWNRQMRGKALNYLTLAWEYAQAGLAEDALLILRHGPGEHPMILYCEGYIRLGRGEAAAAKKAFLAAEALAGDYCFPSRRQDRYVLECAVRTLEKAPMAHYYLGCLLYDKKQYDEAIGHWEQAIREKPGLAGAHRNLSIACYNRRGDAGLAWSEIEMSCRLDPDRTRSFLERDQLAARRAVPVSQRLSALEVLGERLHRHDVLYLQYIALLNCAGRYAEALDALTGHRFHPWEGGEGRVSGQFRYALTALALKEMEKGKEQEALSLLERTLVYPRNLGEGKLPNVPDNEAYYWMGAASRKAGDEEEAKRYFSLATAGSFVPERVLYYNDQPSDYIYYKGLSHRALGEEDLAKKAFHQLISYGERHIFDKMEYDFFAVSLPELEVYQEDLQLRNTQYCNYLRALGCLGLHRTQEAQELLRGILRLQPDHQGALALTRREGIPFPG